ncbi:lytic transglycosylase domain-containing protein [Sphingomonas sp.]|jgi:soluble lytic murein transglycosylase|uniref:lytic transglycosylase domain-containing protein n=1 Tax=Sphingomonas sp. TaxID=28214 RepID=UPI002E32B145|nr:lytic transglycosylase domain-containing protein [Sphingomonas sp.]HEX4693532.1 lytic transglycosylase domain-containing protein [Sphingomonas sp.]
MIASWIKLSVATAALSGMAATGYAFQDQLDWAKSRLAGSAADPMAMSALSASITEWRSLKEANGAPFDNYARFLLAHPGWPGEAQMRRAAESALGQETWSASTAVSFFRRYPPQTATAWIRFAQALNGTGARDEAKSAARSGWVMGALSPADESFVLTTFPDALTPADHDARMDQLLWQGQTAAAGREILLTSAARRPLLQARLDLRTNAPGAGAADALGAGDPGYLADKAIWLTSGGAGASARSLLARPHSFTTLPTDVDRWYDLLLKNARAALAAGEYSNAYAIASQVDDAYPAGTDVSLRPLGERDPYTDLVWLAGSTALKQLGRPAEAIGMFVRYTGGSRSTALKSKGFYWAGRAAEAAGRAEEARGYLARAAAYRDQFYGQLAAERLGQPLLAPTDPGQRSIDPSARQAFYKSEVVRAAQFLGTIGAHEDQTAFLRQIANDATTDSDHALAAELARTLDRPDLAVMVGRSALLNGLPDYSLTGFPTVSIPATAAGSWTIAHAIMRQESQFDRALISRAGARGMMQLMPGSAREQAGKSGLSWDSGMLLSSTDYNIQLGTAYFQRLYNTYGSYPLAIAAYNAGGGNVNKWLAANGDPRTGAVDWVDWIEAIPFEETRRYVQHVLENAVVYDLINPQRATSTGSARLSWYLGNKRPG